MNLISRFIKRWKFRNSISSDQSQNVVDGMVKAKALYKELSLLAHPDRNQEHRDVAEELMKKVVQNRHNYSQLLMLKAEIKEKLQNIKEQ